MFAGANLKQRNFGCGNPETILSDLFYVYIQLVIRWLFPNFLASPLHKD